MAIAWAPGAWVPGAWAGTVWADVAAAPGNAWRAHAWFADAWFDGAWALNQDSPQPQADTTRRGFIDIPPAFRDEPEAVLFLIAAAYYRTH
jgi:hypothetical protein